MNRCLVLILVIFSQLSLAANRPAPFVGLSLQEANCDGNVFTQRGPWDYTSRAKLSAELHLIEKHHFNSNVERLIRGQTSVRPDPDLFFTLRHWPNHHRALNSVSIYDKKIRNSTKKLSPPAECWLQRAINFSPKDPTSHMLYAIFLQRNGHYKEAHMEYDMAEELSPRDVAITYNHGLLLVKMKRYDEAIVKARKAYAAGFPLPGLKNKLKAHGYTEDLPQE